ncbi:hypothetical protein NXZ12_21835, partial [Escherichia coli]|nr:hypothetical protein [Escherichia coli]
RVWRRLLENSLSAKVSCWLIRLLILGSGYNTMISHLGLIRTFHSHNESLQGYVYPMIAQELIRHISRGSPFHSVSLFFEQAYL